jgi:hypothetical protein
MLPIVPTVLDTRVERYMINRTKNTVARWFAPTWPSAALIGAGPPLLRKGDPGDIFELVELTIETHEYHGLRFESRRLELHNVLEIPGEKFASIA